MGPLLLVGSVSTVHVRRWGMMNGPANLDLAILHLEEAVRLAPDKPRYALLLADAYLLKKDAEAALGPLVMAWQARAAPRTAGLLALTLFCLGRYSEAERYAAEALHANEAFTRARALRAWALLAQGSAGEAARDFRRLLEAPPGDPMAPAGLLAARALARLGGDVLSEAEGSDADLLSLAAESFPGEGLESLLRRLLATPREAAEAQLESLLVWARERFLTAHVRAVLDVTGFHLASRVASGSPGDEA